MLNLLGESKFQEFIKKKYVQLVELPTARRDRFALKFVQIKDETKNIVRR
jgi:hypothetical protein